MAGRSGVIGRKLSIISLLVAWLCANGLMLDVMQCVAWAKMFAGYAPHMSVTAALSETFDPAKPCQLCTRVAEARSQQTLPTSQTVHAIDKIVLIAQSAPARVTPAPAREAWPRPWAENAERRIEAVPQPPPRV